MTDEQEIAVWKYVDQKVTSRHRAGRATQELCSFTRNFFQAFSIAEIPRVLDEWNLPERIRLSLHQRVIVTAYGIREPRSFHAFTQP